MPANLQEGRECMTCWHLFWGGMKCHNNLVLIAGFILSFQQEVRRVYATMDEENFQGWVFGNGYVIHYSNYYLFSTCILIRKTIKSEENKAVITRLVKEVRALNPSFDAADIRGNG